LPDLVRNKKAFHDYHVLDKFEAGIVLQGTEVKSCRAHNIALSDAHVRPRDGELFLVGAHIAQYDKGNRNNHEPTRLRKLLMHRREIRKVTQAIDQKGLTLVPLRFYLAHGKIKVEIGLCRGKQLHDKRQTMRSKQHDMEARRAMQR